MRRRILISAYYCSPYQGGEAAVGWQVASHLAQLHDVTVICGDLSGDSPIGRDIERARSEGKIPPGLEIHHVQADAHTQHIHDLHALPGLWFLYYRAYRKWQLQALREARRLHAAQPFDLVHHLTIIGYREPGYLWQLGIPFFWGPLNGAAALPWPFISGFGLTGIYRHVIRNVMNAIQMRTSSRCRAAARAATQIWAVTREDQQMVENLWHAAAEQMIETGATPDPAAAARTRAETEPLRLVWCGLIEARKALHLALQAIARMENVELHVIGDGPEKSRCLALAEELACTVVWHGRVDHAEVRRLMQQGHALFHSSVKEGTPHVVLEAMSSGMPVLCHDACGMGTAVDATSGLKVPLVDPSVSVAGFRLAILRLLDEPELLPSLSTGAIARSHTLSWEGLIGRLDRAYQSLPS
ncbi:MAG: glycosyltransferase family 1 protein [Akkermansiaceae bacterium]|nr:glycosyltransferase family 1 protein [Akkermansiaceae bacterium]